MDAEVGLAQPRPWCRAPSGHLYLSPWGEVRTCCEQQVVLGTIPRDRLADIWWGPRRLAIERQVGTGDLTGGCGTCATQAVSEGRASSYAATFDGLAERAPEAWPSMIEFNLSNRCNLQCVQCNPELSSAIRQHQTDLPPIPVAYDDAFFDDLVPFLTRLDRAQFAGGEPFLARENHRVWGLMAEHAPHVACTVITNGTVWTPGVERALDALRMDVVVSIDGATDATFEAVRVGASFASVLANLDRFRERAGRAGTTVSINHCLMVQNHHEFAALLLLAEERGLAVDVSVVRRPAHVAIALLDDRELQAVARRLADDAARVRDRLVINRAVLDREVARVAAWAAQPERERRHAFDESRFARSLDLGPTRTSSVADARREVAAWSGGGATFELVLARSVIRSYPEALDGLLGTPPGRFVGEPPDAMVDAMVARYGPLLGDSFHRVADDRIDIEATYERATARVVLVPAGPEASRMVVAIREGHDGGGGAGR